MYPSFLCFFIIIIPLVTEGLNSTTEINSPKNHANETKLEMLSEGGRVIPKIRNLSLPMENHTNLITLDSEIGKTKEKSIVPRKGVIYNQQEDIKTANNTFPQDRIDTSVTKANSTKENKTEDGTLLKPVPSVKYNMTQSLETSSSTSSTTTKIPKKPLVVSYEVLSEINKEGNSASELEISSKTIAHDQIPTPSVKIHSVTNHPGMVMPVVITMLVVPMFAVLGYLALRRGQEAWKNRHYKRMDFLLDGMYND